MINVTLRQRKKYGIGLERERTKGIRQHETIQESVRDYNLDYYNYISNKKEYYLEKTYKEREYDRNYRSQDNALQRGLSCKLNYFFTITSKDLKLSKNPDIFEKRVSKELKKQGLIFILFAEPFRDIVDPKTGKIYDEYVKTEYRGEFINVSEIREKIIDDLIEHDKKLIDRIELIKEDLTEDNETEIEKRIAEIIQIRINEWKDFIDKTVNRAKKTRNCWHIHGLVNKPIDFTPFINEFNSDPDCLYCERLYENKKNIKLYGREKARDLQQCFALKYAMKFMWLSKKLLPKGTHLYLSNIPQKEYESSTYIKNDDTGEEILVRENKKAKESRLKKEREKIKHRKAFHAFMHKQYIKKVKREQIKAYRYQLLYGVNNLINSDTVNVYSLNAYKGGYLPYGFIPFNGIVYSVYGDYREKDVLMHGLCSPIIHAHQPICAKRGAPSLPGVRWIGATATATPLCLTTCLKCKKTRFMFIEDMIKSHTGTNGVPMPLLCAFSYINKRKQSDTRLYASLIPFSKRLFAPMLSEFMRYIVYVAHIPDG